MPAPRYSAAATPAAATDNSPVGRMSERRLCTVTAPLSPTTRAPPTAATTDAWSGRRSSTAGETKSDPINVVTERSTLRPVAIPMIRPARASSTASNRPAPVSGKPNRTSSIVDAMVRPGSMATMPPATMKAKSRSRNGIPHDALSA